MPILFILLIAVPLIELYFLIQIGSVIGGFTTILLTILTALLGSWLIRQQGMITFIKAQKNLSMGQLPAMEMLEGLILLIAGVMLLTPGFITDTLGFLLLIPPLRQAFILSLANKFIVRQNIYTQQQNPYQQRPSHQDYIEGEYTKDD